MNAISTNVIIADTLEGIGQGKLTSYLAHALCLDGEAEFDFNGGSAFLSTREIWL